MQGKYRRIAELAVNAVNNEASDLDAIEAVEDILTTEIEEKKNMAKSKLRKLQIEDKMYIWSVAKAYPNKTEVKIWNADMKEIISKLILEEATDITPSMVVEHIIENVHNEKI